MIRAAVTFTLISSASALSNLRSARQRELPTSVNGHLAIEDTCNQYQTKDDCCAEVNCLFEGDACKPRTDASQNGECDASRGAPTNGKNDAAVFNSGAESAQKQMLGSLGTGEVQAKAAGARSPPLPDEPACEGTGEPCTFPLSGEQAVAMLDPNRKASKGGVIRAFETSADKLKELGEAVGKQFSDLKLAHEVNQNNLDVSLDGASEDAAKSYAKRVMATAVFARKIGHYEFSASVAENSVKKFKKRLDEMMTKVKKSVDGAKKSLETKKASAEKVLETVTATNSICDTNIAAVVDKPDDDPICKAKKQTIRAGWNSLKSKLGEFETEAKNFVDELIPTFVEMMDTMSKTAEDDKKKIEGTEAEIKKVVGEYGKAVKTAVEEIKKAEKEEMKKIDASVAAASESGAQVVKGKEMTGQEVMKDKAIMGDTDVRAAGAEAAKGLVMDASRKAATLFVETKTSLHDKLKHYQGKNGLTHLLYDAMHHALMAPSDSGSGSGGSVVEIEGQADNSVLNDARKEISTLTSEIKSIKGDTTSPRAAESIHLEKYTTAMTHIDSMVVKMKLALQCLKQYLAYYQTGASQTQTVFKTDHEAIIQLIREHTVGLMATSKKVHEFNQVLIGQIAKTKSFVMSLESKTQKLQNEFTSWDDKVETIKAIVDSTPRYDPEDTACKNVKIVEPKEIKAQQQIEDDADLAEGVIDDDFLAGLIGDVDDAVQQTDAIE